MGQIDGRLLALHAAVDVDRPMHTPGLHCETPVAIELTGSAQ